MRATSSCHAQLDVVELVPAPGVRLGQVEVGAVVVAGEQPVALGADRIVGSGDGRVVVAQPSGVLDECLRSLRRASSAQIERCALVGELAERSSGLAPDLARVGAGQRLATRRDLAVGRRVHEAGAQPVECLRDGRQAGAGCSASRPRTRAA